VTPIATLTAVARPVIGNNDPNATRSRDFPPLMIERFTAVAGDTLHIVSPKRGIL
jgi:hypothetical protein